MKRLGLLTLALTSTPALAEDSSAEEAAQAALAAEIAGTTAFGGLGSEAAFDARLQRLIGSTPVAPIEPTPEEAARAALEAEIAGTTPFGGLETEAEFDARLQRLLGSMATQ